MERRCVVLVDEANRELGTCNLVEAHSGTGKLHRAFSAYVFRKHRNELLIQQRSAEKMLWPSIWANSCCSHPRVGEDVLLAGMRRLQEELGFSCDLKPVANFVYRAEDADRGVEHEHVTVLQGLVDDSVVPHPNPHEVAMWTWVYVDQLQQDMRNNPVKYAPWFHRGMKILAANP